MNEDYEIETLKQFLKCGYRCRLGITMKSPNNCSGGTHYKGTCDRFINDNHQKTEESPGWYICDYIYKINKDERKMRNYE